MALASQGFSQSVSRHILHRDPFNVNLAVLGAFSQPVLMYINMAKAGLKFDGFFIHKSCGVFVVAENRRLLAWVISNLVNSRLL